MSSSPKPKEARNYDLEFDVRARKGICKAGWLVAAPVRKKTGKERLVQPRVEKDKLSGMADCYKIKLKSAGYRLVYQVVEHRVVVTVIAVGKRERSATYEARPLPPDLKLIAPAAASPRPCNAPHACGCPPTRRSGPSCSVSNSTSTPSTHWATCGTGSNDTL